MRIRQNILPIARELIVDLFAGGGGWSTGFEMATGQHPHIAINHDSDAISMHQANHPQTRHYKADVFEVCPRQAVGNMPVGWLHLSPDCTHHSQAKGGQPRNRKIRALAWVGIRWVGQVRPRILSLENVKQMLNWGPLIAKRCPKTNRVLRLDGTVAPKGQRTPLEEQYLVPCKRRAGETWKRFVSVLRSLGYEVQWQRLVASDHGAGTTRDRLFLLARCDGAPIVWPDVTHVVKPTHGQLKVATAADAIDWTIAGNSIYQRPRPLADASMRRILTGVQRYVMQSENPFMAPANHPHGPDELVSAFLIRYYGAGGQWGDLREPMATITTKHRLALVTVHMSRSSREIVDIKLRMLEPKELYKAQGFPDNYIITHGHDGRIFSKTAQVKMCGNSVSPLPAEALVRSNWNPCIELKKVA
jgi:DNA (cytosine-5)-methyltransferase 1